MPRTPRSQQFDPRKVSVFHCINRCVRQCFLCGVGNIGEGGTLGTLTYHLLYFNRWVSPILPDSIRCICEEATFCLIRAVGAMDSALENSHGRSRTVHSRLYESRHRL